MRVCTAMSGLQHMPDASLYISTCYGRTGAAARPNMMLFHSRILFPIGTASSKHARKLLAIQNTQHVQMLAVRRY